MAEKMTNQEKLDQMHELMIEVKKDSDFMMHELDDMHLTLNWIRRRERIRMFVTSFYWIFIIGISLGAYYFVQPLIGGLLTSFGGDPEMLNGIEKSVGSLPDLNSLKNMLHTASSTQ